MSEAVVTVTRPQKTGYLPSLDGWRALAIVGVMITHDRPFDLFGHSSLNYKGYGGYGVYLFFAISGLLITTRILEEEEICGYFDIRRFYIRRIFRIQPAALACTAFGLQADVPTARGRQTAHETTTGIPSGEYHCVVCDRGVELLRYRKANDS
jgi:peptidoglycan/LPS O-acetylase OafA/YrhL